VPKRLTDVLLAREAPIRCGAVVQGKEVMSLGGIEPQQYDVSPQSQAAHQRLSRKPEFHSDKQSAAHSNSSIQRSSVFSSRRIIFPVLVLGRSATN
jgi:hypothetical protein